MSVRLETRTRRLVLFLLVVGALLLLAANLSRLSFNVASVQLNERNGSILGDSPAEASDDEESIIERILPSPSDTARFILFGVLAPTAIIVLLTSADARRRLREDLMLILSFVLLLFVLSRFVLPAFFQPKGNTANDAVAATGDAIGDVPIIFVYATSFVMSALLVGCGTLIWRLSQRSNQTLDAVAFQARTALNRIEAGHDLRETIIQCYRAMMRAAAEFSQVERQDGMTTREFETTLITNGMPAAQVNRLTRLFEQVRYGGVAVTDRELGEARFCLQAIIETCSTIKTQ